MKNIHRTPRGGRLTATAALLSTLTFPLVARAQTNVKIAPLNAGIDVMSGTEGKDGVDFQVRPSVDPAEPIMDRNTLLFFNTPPTSVDWRDPRQQWLQ